MRARVSRSNPTPREPTETVSVFVGFDGQKVGLFGIGHRSRKKKRQNSRELLTLSLVPPFSLALVRIPSGTSSRTTLALPWQTRHRAHFLPPGTLSPAFHARIPQKDKDSSRTGRKHAGM